MFLTKLEHWAQQYPDQPALHSETGSWSWREYHAAVCDAAAQLSAMKINRLALALDNSPEWAIIDLACLCSGIVCIPLPAFFSDRQQRWLLDSSGADAIVGGALRTGWTPADFTFGQLQRCPRGNLPVLPAGTAKVTYTSGTTGEPRGVCLSRKNLAWSTETLGTLMLPLALQRHLVTLPLCTLLENLCGIYVPLSLGAATVILSAAGTGFEGSSKFSPAIYAQVLAKWQPQSLVLVPELLRLLLHIHSAYPTSTASLRLVAAGGGKISPALLSHATAKGLPVYEGYGLSECGSVVTLNLPGNSRTGSAGKPLPGISVTIDGDGELWVESPGNAAGYLNAPAATGPVKTGDIAHMDDEGFVYITGRRSNVQINAFGRNFSPEWIEAEAITCPAVRRVVIFGEGMTKNVALVDALPGMEPAAREQLNALSATLPDYARLHHLIFTPAISSPAALTANGRARRGVIWQMMREQILSQSEEA
ncbi:AMP-binding protein [Pantoea sp. B65]|uniref:AMP-binding protein n=1 Tax=Pantoea sp. B65 TaxID=2813359 RepID=UPI0039B5C840